MRHILIAAVAAALALSQAAWAQSAGGAGGTSGSAAGTGGNAASTAGTSSAAVSGQSLGAGNVPSQPGITPGSSNPGGVNGGLGIPQQAPGTNSLGTASSAGSGATGGGGSAGGSRGTTVGRSSVDVTGPNKPGSLDVTDPLQKEVDKKINGICRGC